jgi:hypothetical protein
MLMWTVRYLKYTLEPKFRSNVKFARAAAKILKIGVNINKTN